MPFNTDEQLLDEMKGLPNMKMNPDKKQGIVNAIRQEDTRKRVHASTRFSTIGKGVAICSVLVAAFWMGATLVGNNQPSAMPPDTPPQTTAPGTSASLGTGTNHVGTTNPSPGVPQSEELLANIRKQAEKGLVINSPYPIETSLFDEVEKDLGNPDTKDSANGLSYATYNGKQVAFGYNKGMQIVDIRSSDPQLQKITLTEVVNKWGQPNRVSEYGNKTIYTYDVTPKYQVKMIFQGTKSTSSGELLLVRYNLYYPEGNKNLMLYGSNADMLKDLRELAKNGQTFGSSYRVEKDVFDEIEKVLGKPNNISTIKGITYNTYRDLGLVFAFNKGMQVVDIRSYDPRLQAISLAEVNQALGEPQSKTTLNGETIYTYKVNDKYELKIIFTGVIDKKKSTLYIDHVNIYYPRGTINNMAG
ncbi:YjgB family protein [Brevibacillus reuszeri]|uniref:YjgB family protein n=1 Tax=Brevibacillus reuszeri TaxID=54915 RepID=UPI000CCC1A6F|nr:YjgB family protein [Brevibacillus reuszeri]